MNEPAPAAHAVSRPVERTAAPAALPPTPKFTFLRVTGLFAGIMCFASSAFFGGWALFEIGRSIIDRANWGGSIESYHITGIVSAVIGMGFGVAIGLLILSLSRTLATAAGDSRRTAEMIERML